MENSPANHLPEVDSLPDGFVESSVESFAPRTPNFEHEESPADYKDTLLELDPCIDAVHDPSSASDSSVGIENLLSESRTDKVERLRTFPVALSEKDSTDVCEDSLVNKDCVEKTECGSILMPVPGNDHEHQHAEGNCQSSEKSNNFFLEYFFFSFHVEMNA